MNPKNEGSRGDGITGTQGETTFQDLMDRKSELILSGCIVLDRDIILPFPLSRSTAGPGTGTNSLMMGFHGTRVKLRVSRRPGDSEFRLVRRDAYDEHESGSRDGKVTASHRIPEEVAYSIFKGTDPFIQDVEVTPTPIHAPDQAFVNIDARCRFTCLFCSSPHLRNYRKLSNERWIEIIRNGVEQGSIRAVALTSGIPDTIEENIKDFIAILQGIRDLDVPKGVEPYVHSKDQLMALKDAGASELKLNVQSWDREIFGIVCPDLDQDHILRMLEKGVEIFGRNRVSSNLIIGLGESDESIISGMETLAEMGIVAVIRTLHLNQLNADRLARSIELPRIPKERLLRLREEQARILKDQGLDTREFRTMCFPCKGCDLEPMA